MLLPISGKKGKEVASRRQDQVPARSESAKLLRAFDV